MNMSFPGLVICCNDLFLALRFSLGPGGNPCAQTERCQSQEDAQVVSKLLLERGIQERREWFRLLCWEMWASLVIPMKVMPLSFQ